MQRDLVAYTGVVTVQAAADSGMRLPFQDSRKYLIGRQHLWEEIAADLRSHPQRCVLVHGSSGTIVPTRVGRTERRGGGAVRACLCCAALVECEMPMPSLAVGRRLREAG